MTAAAHERVNPFPGLRPFEQEEDYLFFGREAQCHDLLRRLRRTRFLAVVGTSGSGKSSLVRAGLLPALHGGVMVQAGSAWRIALFRPGSNPIGELALALSRPAIGGPEDDDGTQAIVRQAIIETTLRRSSLGLVEVLRQARLSEGEHLLVVVDQFEELFRFRKTITGPTRSDDSAAFVKLLLEASRAESPQIFIVLTMRSDFLGDCAQFRDLPEAINDGQFLIPRMTRDQRRQAIEGPVAVGGARMTSRLVQRLLNDVGDNPDQLPILQHALMRTWDHWQETRDEELDLPHYEATGGMAEAMSNHADEIYTDLPDDRSRTIAETIFKRLTDKGLDNRGSRRPTRLDELCAVSSAIEATEADVIAVIEAFRQPGRSLVVPPAGIPLKADSVVDISHESLMRIWERLRTWVEEEARAARGYRRLAETAVLYKTGQAGLWRDPDLQLALNWHEQQHPNTAWAVRYHPAFEAAMQFLETSCEAREAERARQEADRQRELEQARALTQAAEARRKAEEQARRDAEALAAAQARANRLGLLLGVVLLLVLLGLGAGLFIRMQEAAQDAEKTAQDAEKAAQDVEKAAMDWAELVGAVIVYPECGYGGKAVTLQPGRYNLEQRGVKNDTLSSIRVARGYLVRIYDADNFQGTMWEFTADNACFGQELNDKASSIVVITTGAIACYSHNREGSRYSVGGDIYVMGIIDGLPGKYIGPIFHPEGYENKDISKEQVFKDLCNARFSACQGGCWAGGHTR